MFASQDREFLRLIADTDRRRAAIARARTGRAVGFACMIGTAVFVVVLVVLGATRNPREALSEVSALWIGMMGLAVLHAYRADSEVRLLLAIDHLASRTPDPDVDAGPRSAAL